MRTNHFGVTEKASIRTDLNKYGENYDRIFNEDKQVNRTITVVELMKLNEMFTDKIDELEKKLEIAREALEYYADCNSYDRKECESIYIASKALAEISPNITISIKSELIK